jgi:hypothetical protein
LAAARIVPPASALPPPPEAADLPQPRHHGHGNRQQAQREQYCTARRRKTSDRSGRPDPAYTLAAPGTARLRGGSSAHRGSNGLRSSFK